EACETFFGSTTRSAIVSRMVRCELIRQLKRKCQLDDVVLKHEVAAKEESVAQRTDGAINACVSVADRIGSSISRKQDPGKIVHSNEIECPRACQCSLQLFGSLPLLFG